MDPLVSAINFVLSSELNNRQFRYFLKEVELLALDLPFQTEFSWLDLVKLLSSFFELRIGLSVFLREKNRPYPAHFCC